MDRELLGPSAMDHLDRLTESMSHVTVTDWPSFFPAQVNRVISRSAKCFARRYKRGAVYLPTLERAVETAYIQPDTAFPGKPPVCFLHGFDSSSFDFRKLLPYVEAECETWAVDLVGWGFSDHSLFLDDPSLPNGPEVKREHLYHFWRSNIGRPMCLMGVSLGGAVAVDFALHHPEAVDALVLSAAQGYTDGLGMLSRLPTFAARLGVNVLQTEALRRAANKIAYQDEKLDVEQAMIIGRLHTLLPGWTEASLAFIRSDGYSLSKKISAVDVPTLILWGRKDRVLGTDSAERFAADIKNAKLCWIENCGHAGHIERYTELGDNLLSFLEERRQ